MNSKRVIQSIMISALCCLLLGAQWPKGSLYEAPLKWVTDQGKPAQLSNWSGKNVVITMAYTSCHGSCPLIMQKLRKVEKLFAEKKIDASFVIVSFDPKNDTPQALREYREEAGVTEKNWTFLTGKETDVRRLSMLLEISYSKNPGSHEIMHDNKIILLSPQGEIRRTLKSLDEKETQLLD